jgi:hypothetical protein
LQGLLQQYKEQLVDDPIVHTHLSELYDRLLEQNLLRLIEPFSRVEIAHIAKLIGLSLEVVERKLSQVRRSDALAACVICTVLARVCCIMVCQRRKASLHAHSRLALQWVWMWVRLHDAALHSPLMNVCRSQATLADLAMPCLQMILDKKFAGTLDQGNGCLDVFDEEVVDKIYPQCLDIVESMGRVVDTLFSRSQKVVTV